MSDNITLPREVVEEAAESLEWADSQVGGDDCYEDAAKALRAALAAPQPEPVAWMRKEWSPDCGSYFDLCAEEEMGWRDRKEWTPLYAAPPAAAPQPEPVRHPGYVIGDHWFETAYERLCAGETEDAILEDYEVVREPRLRDLRRDAESWRQFQAACTRLAAIYALKQEDKT